MGIEDSEVRMTLQEYNELKDIAAKNWTAQNIKSEKKRFTTCIDELKLKNRELEAVNKKLTQLLDSRKSAIVIRHRGYRDRVELYTTASIARQIKLLNTRLDQVQDSITGVVFDAVDITGKL